MIPKISHLQFMILQSLHTEEKTGKQLRNELRLEGVKRTKAAFYQLMNRMEWSGLIKSNYKGETPEYQQLKDKYFNITKKGIIFYTKTIEFYSRFVK